MFSVTGLLLMALGSLSFPTFVVIVVGWRFQRLLRTDPVRQQLKENVVFAQIVENFSDAT